jgi:hypothetical protein
LDHEVHPRQVEPEGAHVRQQQQLPLGSRRGEARDRLLSLLAREISVQRRDLFVCNAMRWNFVVDVT